MRKMAGFFMLLFGLNARAMPVADFEKAVIRYATDHKNCSVYVKDGQSDDHAVHAKMECDGSYPLSVTLDSKETANAVYEDLSGKLIESGYGIPTCDSPGCRFSDDKSDKSLGIYLDTEQSLSR